LKILNEFLKGKYQIGANLKFDCKFLRNLGVTNVKVDFDTLSAGHCLNETASNALSAHGWMYTYYGGHEIELQKYKVKHPKLVNYSQIPISILSEYATKDAIICYQAYKKQIEKLSLDPQLYSYYFKEVVPNLNLYVDIELNGVVINWDLLKEMKIKKDKELEDLTREIHDEMGVPVNLSSAKDLGLALENDLKLPDLGLRSKDGYYLTNEDVLLKWKKLGYSVVDKLIGYRSLTTQINTFIGEEQNNSAYWEYRNKSTNSIHPTYSVMLAQSHRNKCKSPNLQQVPKKTEFSKEYRKIFVAPEQGKYYLSEGDFAGFQLRIAAVLSGDQNLKDAFTKYGGDVHSMTAIAIFHQDWTIEQFLEVKKQEPYKTQRGIAKNVNFGFLFGGSAWSFANDKLRAEWDLDFCLNFLKEMNLDTNSDDPFLEAAEYIRNTFFKKYPKLLEWHDKCHETAKKYGMIRSPFGARRLLPRLTYIGKDTDRKEISEDQNISKNSPVQNFESVAIMRGMREFHELVKKNNWKSRIFGMIHDAVGFYIHKDERSFMVKTILDIFQRQYEEYEGVHMEFELEISDPELGEVWGFGKEVKE
jgi:DNA polymerase-1